jgi:hypothetical protein
VEGQSVDYAKTVNDARVSFIQLLGGAGLLGGLAYTIRTFGLSRTTQRAERFTKAVGQIGDKESITLRIGGVYSLKLLAAEDQRYWPVVEQILSGMIRERAKPGPPLSPDLQVALTTLGERPGGRFAGRRPLDLRKVHIPRAHLVGANLEKVWLDDAYMEGVDLTDARLKNSRLRNATLENAILSSADLTAADFNGSNLKSADFYKANTDSADFTDTDRAGAMYLDHVP